MFGHHNIQGSPTPHLFEKHRNTALFLYAYGRQAFTLAASELRSIVVALAPRQLGPVRNTITLAAAALRNVIVSTGYYSPAVRSTITLAAAALRTVIVPVGTFQNCTALARCSLLTAELKTVVKHVPSITAGTVKNSFSLAASTLT
jgi:hypothetical protein